MKLVSDSQILDPKYRKQVIAHIKCGENVARKREMKKRHEVYKDLTVKWVIKKLEDEGLKRETIQIMANRAANVSICRKVVNKLARSYNGGVIRETGTESGNMLISDLVALLSFDARQKKADRYRKLFKNAAVMTVPDLQEEIGDKKVYALKNMVLAPWQYDVLEWQGDCENAGALILSDYVETSLLGLPVNNSTALSKERIDESVASRDRYSETYIWWSDQYHFTTNEKGQIIKLLSPDDLANPIQRIPAYFYADDRDGSFWATGGEDLTDGSILVNTMMTDMNAIAYIQGWGQFVVTGRKVPEHLQGGPHSALVLLYEGGDDPKPEVTVVNAQPPLSDWRAMIEQYVAILLSTNDCSPSTVAGKLDSTNFPSGIAMIIEKSEANNSVEEAQKEFRDGEKHQWEIVKRWQNTLLESKSLSDEFAELGPYPADMEVSVKFNELKEVVTEADRLANIKTRKDLGINTLVQLVMQDNPDMTEQQAMDQVAKIQAEKLSSAATDAAKTVDQNVPA